MYERDSEEGGEFYNVQRIARAEIRDQVKR